MTKEAATTKLESIQHYTKNGVSTPKTSGVSSGSVYTIDGQTFMVKDFSKDGKTDIKQILQEVIGSKLARLFMQEINPSLIESYPKVNFVENDKQEITSTSSQYIAEFKTMLDYMREHPEVRSSTQGTINAPEIQEMLDVEFVAALLSHNDLNTRNRGVRQVGDEYYSSIIDFTNCLDSASTNSLNYPAQWLSDDASIDNVITSLGKITANITEDKITTLVDQVFNNLPEKANQFFLQSDTKTIYTNTVKTKLTEKLTRIKAEKSALEYLRSVKKDQKTNLTNAKALLDNVKNNLVSTAVMQKLLEKNPDIFDSIINKQKISINLRGAEQKTGTSTTTPPEVYDKIFLSAIAAKNQDIFNVFIKSTTFTMTFNSLNDAIKASIKSRNELSLNALLNDTTEVLDNNGRPVDRQLLMITKCLELKDFEYLKTILGNSAEKDKNKLIVGALYDSITFEDKASFEYLYTTYPEFLVQPRLTAYLSRAMIASNDDAFDKLLSKMSTKEEFDEVIIKILDSKSTLKDAKKIIYCEKIIENSTDKDKLITSAFYNSITFRNNVIFDHLLQNHMSSLTNQNSLPQNQHLYDYLYTAMNKGNNYAFDALLSKMSTKEEFRGAIEKSIALKKTNYLQEIITKAKSALNPLEFNDLLIESIKTAQTSNTISNTDIIKTFAPNLIENINSANQEISEKALQSLSDLIKTPEALTNFNKAIKTVPVANKMDLFKKMIKSITVTNLDLINAVADNLYPKNEQFIKETLEDNRYTTPVLNFIHSPHPNNPELALYCNSFEKSTSQSFNVSNTTCINPAPAYITRLPVSTNLKYISWP